MKVGLFSKQHNNARVESELQSPLGGVCMLWEGWNSSSPLRGSWNMRHSGIRRSCGIFLSPEGFPSMLPVGFWGCSWAQEDAVAHVGCCPLCVICLNKCPQGCEQGDLGCKDFREPTLHVSIHENPGKSYI